MTCRLSVVCLVCIFSPALAKTYEPTERMAACVQIDLDPAHEKYEYCKEALGDAQNNMEVHRLLEKGHDPNTVLDTQGRTAILMAAQRKDKETVAELLNFGMTLGDKSTNPNAATTGTGHTGLIVAAGQGDVDMVQMFLGAKADPNQALTTGIKAGYTALHMAAEFGRVRIVKMLVEAGADPKVKTAAEKDVYAIVAETKVGMHRLTKKDMTEQLDKFVNLDEDEDEEF